MASQNPRVNSRDKPVGSNTQNPWHLGRSNQGDHGRNKRGNNSIGRMKNNQRRGRGRNIRGNTPSVEPQQPHISAPMNGNQGLGFAPNCGMPTVGMWQPQLVHPGLAPQMGGAGQAPVRYFTPQHAQPQVGKPDLRNQTIKQQTTTPNNQHNPMYGIRQPNGYMIQNGMRAPMTVMGPGALPGGLMQTMGQPMAHPSSQLMNVQVKSPNQPSQPSGNQSTNGRLQNQETSKESSKSSLQEGKAECPTVAFGQHSMNNMRTNTNMLGPRLPPYFQYAIPAGWTGVQGLQGAMPNQIPRQMTQPPFPINNNPMQFGIPMLPNMHMNGFIPIPVGQQPNVHQGMEKSPMMVPCLAAALEMRQKFKAAADPATEANLAPPTSSKSFPTPIKKIKSQDPPSVSQEAISSQHTPLKSPGGLNPNATTFTPCATPTAPTPPKFFEPNNNEVHTFKPIQYHSSPPVSQKVIHSQDLASTPSHEQDDLKEAWLGKGKKKRRSSPGDATLSLEALTTPMKLISSAHHDDADEKAVTSPRAQSISNVNSAKRWSLRPKDREYNEKNRDKRRNEENKTAVTDEIKIHTERRSEITGKQQDWNGSIEYPLLEILRFQSVKEFADMPDEIRSDKEKNKHFRTFKGEISDVKFLMDTLLRKELARRRALEESPVNIPLPPTSKNAWVSTVSSNARKIEHDEMISRKVKSFLNKITPDKFPSISSKIVNFCQENVRHYNHLENIAKVIFDKACHEPIYSHLYAELCNLLSQSLNITNTDDDQKEQDEKKPNETEVKKKKNPFRHALLSECQKMFNKGTELEEHGAKDSKNVELTEEQKNEKRLKAKEKVIGNMKFIGELFKLKVIHERITHSCIQHLLTNDNAAAGEECGIISMMDLEATVNLLKTAGKELDRVKAQSWVDQYFNYLHHHANNLRDKRIMFMVQNLEELRSNGWVSSREKLKTKAEIKLEHPKFSSKSARRDRSSQVNRRTGGQQSRSRPSSMRVNNNSQNRNRQGSSRRSTHQQMNNNSSKWVTVGGHSPQSKLSGGKMADTSPLIKKSVRPSNKGASKWTRDANVVAIPPQNRSQVENKSESSLTGFNRAFKSFKSLWPIVQETIEHSSGDLVLSESKTIRNKAIMEISRSAVRPQEFISGCMEKFFETSVGTMKHRRELATLLKHLDREDYLDQKKFQAGIFLYVKRFEDFIVDCPNMALNTIELIDRFQKNKDLAMECIEGALEILSKPLDEHNSDLCGYLGRGLLQYMDGAKGKGMEEREGLVQLLAQIDLTRFFSFKSHKDDPAGKPGSVYAQKFLANNPLWLELAGF